MAVTSEEFVFLREIFQFLTDTKKTLNILYNTWERKKVKVTAVQTTDITSCIRNIQSNIIEARAKKLPRIMKYKYAEHDIIAMETNYSLLKELSEDKEKCMDTLLNITEVEEYYQTVSAEVDSRALNFTVTPCPQDEQPATKTGQQLPGRHYNNCVYAVRSAWDWLIQEARCQDVHLRNAAQYHQFHFEVRHYDEGVRYLLATLQNHDNEDTPNKQKNDAHSFVKEVQEMLQRLLDYQTKVEGLFAVSGHIVPLHLRKEMPDMPLKVYALTGYRQTDLTVEEGEAYWLIDNTEVTKWKVRSMSGKEGIFPAIIFLIPPPDRTAVGAASRLRQQLHATWKDCMLLLKRQAREFFNDYMNSHEAKEMRCVTPQQRSDVCKCLTEIERVLCENSPDNPEWCDLYSKTRDWGTTVLNMQGTSPDRRGTASSLVLHWTGSKKLLRLLEEFDLYCKSYADDLRASRGSKNHFMCDGDMTYTSKAYVERLRPVDIDHMIPKEYRDHLPENLHLSVAEKAPELLDDSSFLDESVTELTVSAAPVVTEEEVESEQTIKETQTFVIVGVIDPRDNEQISIYRAISEGIISQTEGTYKNLVTGETMAIPQAMERGLIIVEYTNKSVETGELIKRGIIRTSTTQDSTSYSVEGVTDPVTGRKISVKQAVKRGIIDQETGRYVNPMTGESMSLSDAIDKGLLDVKIIDENARNNNTEDITDGYANGLDDHPSDLLVRGVRDPMTGRYISLQEAIAKGLIDLTTGEYINPVTGERLSLADAIKRGYVKATMADPTQDKNNLNVLHTGALQGWSDLSAQSIDDLLTAASESGSLSTDVNHTVYHKLKKNMDTKCQGIHEQTTGHEMTIEEAFERGVLHFDPLRLENANGDKYSLPEAAVLGLIEPKALKEVIKAMEPNSLHKLLENHEIDPQTGAFIDPVTHKPMSLSEAIARDKIDPDQLFFVDVPASTVSPLSAAFENRKWDPESGLLVDKSLAQEVTLAKAIEDKVIDPKVDQDKILDQISSLKFLQSYMDTSTGGIKNTQTGKDMSVEESIMAGVLDIPAVQYTDPTTHQTMSIPEAVSADLIDPETAKQIYAAMAAQSLGELLKQHNIDPSSGKYIHPDSKRKMTIKDAIDAGLLDPTAIFYVDPATGDVISLDTAIKEGRFNPVTGKFKDPLTNLEVSISNAIKKGLVEPNINPDHFIEQKSPLKDLMEGGKINAQQATFVTPDGQKMPLKEAIANGYVSPDSIVKIDPKTGVISQVGNTDLLCALVATSGELEWVGEAEKTLCEVKHVVEDEQQIEAKLEAIQDLQKTTAEHKEPIEKILASSQDLLDNKQSSPWQPGSQQQYQRLRFNTSDLKVRFEGSAREVQRSIVDMVRYIEVESHVDGCHGNLSELLGDLKGFHDDLGDLEGWLHEAQVEMDGIKREATELTDMDKVQEESERLNEQALAQEVVLDALNKTGQKVIQQKQSYDRETETFSQSVSGDKDSRVKDRRSTEVPPGDLPQDSVVQQELSNTNDKFKGVLSECTSLMAKLTETASKNKQYNQLKAALTKSLPELGVKVAACSAEVKKGSDAPNQLEALKAVTADVIAQGKQVEDLNSIGQDLIAILEELDCKDTPKAKEIQNTIDSIQNNFDQIQETVVDKQHKLNNLIVQSQDAVHNLNSLLDWVAETEALFQNMRPVSLDRAALNEQIQAHRIITSDIENHREQIDSIVDQCKESPGSSEKTNELLDRFDSLISRAQERGGELDDVVQKLGTLHNNVNQLESWLANAVHSMKRESSDFEPSSLKNKIENLYRQKQAKQDDLNNIKTIGKGLINNPNTGDKNRLRETMADIQSKWHDLTELLVQMISFTALKEIDDLLKYLDKAETEINTAEPISTDPETLSIQLRDHRAFHDDLESKRHAVNDTIDKCNKMLRETTNEEADDIKNKLGTIRAQADLVCKLSGERLALLEEALPLASHFSETHADLQSWLGEIDAEIDSLDVPAESNPEQVRKQQDSAKTSQRIIEDHKPLIEDLKNTGLELMELCTDEDASDLKEDLDHLMMKYDHVKGAIRDKLNQLDDAFRSVTTDVGDSLDGLLEELHYLSDQTEYADPIAADPDVIRDQISENNAIVDDLERRQAATRSIKDAVARILEQETQETAEECEDIRSKLQDVANLTDRIQQHTQQKGQRLEEALSAAEKFQRDNQGALLALHEIQDNLMSQDSPGIDPATIQEQLRELDAIEEELSRAQHPISESQKTGDHLASLCGFPGQTEIQKHREDVDTLLEDIQDSVKDRKDELTKCLEQSERYDMALQAISSWLPKAEQKFDTLSPLSADPRGVKIQLEELKVYKVQVHPRYVDIQNLNQYSSDLKNASPLTAESVLGPQVKDINARWNALLKGIQDREKGLKDALVELGEVDHGMDDVIGFLTETETELQALDDIYGDPKYIETYLKKIQMTQKDLAVQDHCIKKLNRAVDKMVERSGGRSSPLLEKREEMNDMFRTVNVLARDKQNQLQETLKEVKGFMGDVEDILHWLGEFCMQMKSSGPMGALPDTAQKQFDNFMKDYTKLGQKEEEVRMLLLNGEDMLARCRQQDTQSLRENLARLQTKMFDTRGKAERKRTKMEEHLQNVRDFHGMLKVHTDWLSNTEKILVSFKHPSKLVDRVLQQINDHREFRSDIEAHREIMTDLDKTGTYLKYFGRKQDTVYIKNLLISIKLRWKKLVRRADEKGRMLQQAHKEDKRFHDSWKGLCDWLDDSERRMKKYAGAPAKVKQDIDELRAFQHQLGSKHPVYYTTMRLGRSLKDRCTKSDPERDTLNSMLEQLKNRWNIIRSIVAHKQNKLDEALLSSGRLVDALKSLMEWLDKAEGYVAEDQPILGDLDTVNLLIEQHKAFQQELESRQNVFMAMQAAPAGESGLESQLNELNALWGRVNQLSDVREARLQEATKLAEDFNDSVQIIREWLPNAEAELKFRALPEDEDAIAILIEQHEKFQDELRGQQSNIEKIRFLAEEILQACHPNAVRFVKYYLTITQTRWEQALNRADQRSQRLQEALRNIRGNAALLEELLAQLTEAQALLSTKEKDPIPEDLTVVEALVKEHLEFHDDLSNKNKDVERLTKVTNVALKKQLHGSAYRLNEPDTPSPRALTLQNRWRNVWRMSVDRKKKLQDALDQLLELESFKNFDFDMWRQRYVSWIRAKKFRITDFFRRQDKDQDGALTRDEFVTGMLKSKFPTNKTELNAVFDIFDVSRNNLLDYKEFADALKPDRNRGRGGKRPMSESELIHDEIEQQVSHCQCRNSFQVQKVAEGKYKFGERGKMILIRFLNSTVMVRVGGGWVTLDEFLSTNDPCRAKGRLNTEIHEQYLMPDGSPATRANFLSRRRASTPTNASNAPSPSPGALGNKLSGSATCLSSVAESSTNGLRAKNKQRRTSRSCMDLSTAGSSLPPRVRRPPPLDGASRTSTPRRSTLASTAPGDAPRSGRKTPTSTPRSGVTNGRATPTGRMTPSGSRTPSGGVTPNGARSRSPGRTFSATSTPKSGSRSNVGSRGTTTPTGSRTPQSQRSRSPVSGRDTPNSRKLATTTPTRQFRF